MAKLQLRVAGKRTRIRHVQHARQLEEALAQPPAHSGKGEGGAAPREVEPHVLSLNISQLTLSCS